MKVISSLWAKISDFFIRSKNGTHADISRLDGEDVFNPFLSGSPKSFKDALLMPFSEAVGIHRFSEQLTEAVEDEFPKRLLAPLGVQAGDLSIKLTHKLAAYSRELSKGLKSGALTPATTKKGQELLDLIKTGKGTFAGKAVATNGARAASAAASGVTIAMQIAYIATSIDTLKRLQSLDKKADWLVAARRFDQLGKLERIYTHAGELLHMGVPVERVASDVHRLAAELTELRSIWRQEFRERIQKCDPEKIENDWYLFFGDTRRSKRMEQEVEGLNPLRAEIQLIRFSFALQWALMASIQRESVFGRITCNGEYEEWRDLAALFEKKAEMIDVRIKDNPMRAANLADEIRGVSKLCNDLGVRDHLSTTE